MRPPLRCTRRRTLLSLHCSSRSSRLLRSLPSALTRMSPARMPALEAGPEAWVTRRPVVSAFFSSSFVSGRVVTPRRVSLAAVACFSSVALLEPTVTLISCSLPSRKTVIVTSVPGRMVLTREGSVTEEVTFLPLSARMTSRSRRPAFSAGLSFSVFVTRAPSGVLRPRLSASS